MLGVKELEKEDGTVVKLVKLRNPWGTETYHSDYSDESLLWTDKLREDAGSVVSNDGEFFIPINLYKTQIGYT